MKKLFALIYARNKEFYRDRSAMIWTFLFPFIVLAGFTYGYSGRSDPLLRVGVYSQEESHFPVIQALKEIPGISLSMNEDEAALVKKLEHYELDLAMDLSKGDKHLSYTLNQDSEKGRLAERIVRFIAEKQMIPDSEIDSRIVNGKRLRYSDWLLPGLLAMNIMFGSMFGVGYVIVRYRKNGVLKRLRATPLSAFQFLTAQVFSRMFLMVITSYMVILGSMALIGFSPRGNWFSLGVFLCVSSIVMISLGLIVAARIANEEVAEGVLNLMTWPMIFLSGIWFSIEGASPWVLWTAKCMPLTHVVSGLRAILLEGASITDLKLEACILMGLSAVFIGISSSIFRWR